MKGTSTTVQMLFSPACLGCGAGDACRGLLPGEHSDDMEDEDDYEAGVNFQKYAYSRCELQRITMSQHACHVLLPAK
jgi:hypothetical protein